MVGAFGTSICKIWYKNRQTQGYGEFHQSVKSKVIQCAEGLSVDHKHFKKMVKYFPEYTFMRGEEVLYDPSPVLTDEEMYEQEDDWV